MKTLESAGRQAYIVGGSVRDVISDKPVSDWDFTTDAAPDQIQEIFPESFYDNAFGTVGITVEELIAQLELKDYDYQKDGLKLTDVFEITTFRTEGSYSDNRRPDEVKWGKTILEDLERRDFTLNAMALRLSDDSYTLIDEYDGQEDLKNKLIRAVGDPNTRFREDALRMLRAVRLGSQHGFIIEPNTLNAITQNAQLLANISQERIRDELLKIVSAAFAADGLKILLSTGLLHFVLPEMEQTVAVDQAGHHTKDVWHHSIDAMQNCPSQDPIVRLATLLHDVGKPKAYRNTSGKITFYGHEVVGERIVKEIGLRLHLSNKDRERLRILVRHHMFTYDSDMTDAAIRRFIRRVKLENINDMMMLRIGDRVGGGSKQTSWRLRELQRRIGNVLYTPMQIKDMPISGHDLMQELKLPSGPQVGKILKKLFEEVLEDSGKNNREYLMQRAAQILEDIQEESIAS
jgi:putative nucleotidyltransferase with HDIG domain